MERTEYPALLSSLQPGQAVTVLNDRIKTVNKLNADIADWLQERRRVEEAYVRGLRKLSQRQPPDESSDLGIFATPWQKIVSATESLAESHYILAQKIEADVERPLREFGTTNRELQAMSTISGNLASVANDVENAQRKADKLKDKGGKAATGKVANAASEVEGAMSQWDSQAPYVFEKLQAVDESRCNHLRDVLTQLQTHEVDQVERNRVTAEQCLNALLNVETADEIKTFTLRTLSGKPVLERQRSNRPAAAPSSVPASSVPPSSVPPSTPTMNTEDSANQRSGSVQEPPSHGKPSGLKRLGTLLGRRRQSTQQVNREPSPEKRRPSRPSALGSSSFGSFGLRGSRSRDLPPPAESPESTSPARRRSSINRPQTMYMDTTTQSIDPPPSRQARHSFDRPNGTIVESIEQPTSSSGLNDSNPLAAAPQLKAPLQPSVPTAVPEPQKDSEGYSVPPTAPDPISQAEQEAATTNDAPAPQFKVAINKTAIPEEDGDANAALANIASTLRAQAAQPRKQSTTRGRRDVRSTILVPGPQTPELTSEPQSTTSTAFPPISPMPPSASAQSPIKLSHRALLTDDPTASDTGSIRSGRSLSSAASGPIRHPDMPSPGLNTSIIETVSAWFSAGRVTKAVLIGELALAYNPPSPSDHTGSPAAETIRLENFAALEKVAPNPAFIDAVPDAAAGSYAVDLAALARTQVAFKYQVRLPAANPGARAPLLLTAQWKVEPARTSLILSYGLNPTFELGAAREAVALSNVVLVVHLDSSPAAAGAAAAPPGRATSCQSKPVGTFHKDKQLVYWRLGDVALARDRPVQQLRARFFTEGGEARPGSAEARWEIVGENAAGLGSGLSVSRLVRESGGDGEGAAGREDPFADEGSGSASGSGNGAVAMQVWREVAAVRKVASGTYVVQ